MCRFSERAQYIEFCIFKVPNIVGICNDCETYASSISRTCGSNIVLSVLEEMR